MNILPMIHKAGGKLSELLDLAEPENLTEYVLAAIVSEDLLPIRYIVEGHGDIARIELPKKDMHLIFEKNLTEVISEELRKYGCKFVTLDLEGLRSGSLNPDKEVLANEGSKYNY